MGEGRNEGAREQRTPDAFGVYLDQARYLTDYQWRRSSQFETRAMGLLSTDAVLVTLAASLFNPDQLHGWGRWAALAGSAFFTLSAACAALALFPRLALAPAVDGFRQSYLDYRNDPVDDRYLTEEQLTGHLIGGEGDPAILESIASDATRRAHFVRASCVLLVVGMAALVATSADRLLAA